MTSDGSPYTRFRRALDSGNLLVASAAASDLPRVTLPDALALCLLMRDHEPARFEAAALRWHSRWLRETRGVTAGEAQLCLAALLALPGPGATAGAEALLALCELRGLPKAAAVVERWLHR